MMIVQMRLSGDEADDHAYRSSFLNKLCDLSRAGGIVIDQSVPPPPAAKKIYYSEVSVASFLTDQDKEIAKLQCQVRGHMRKDVRDGLEGRLQHLLRERARGCSTCFEITIR